MKWKAGVYKGFLGISFMVLYPLPNFGCIGKLRYMLGDNVKDRLYLSRVCGHIFCLQVPCLLTLLTLDFTVCNGPHVSGG